MPLHNLTRFPRLEFIGAPTPLEYLPRFSDYLDGKFSSNGMTSLPWQWAAINYVSWNFSRQMLCVKVPIR